MSENIKIPECVGIIMDGNRRWAKEKGLPLMEGHRVGLESLKEIAKFSNEAGIKNLILFTFSTENWNRAKEEVDYLMSLFRIYFEKEINMLAEQNIIVRVAGEMSRFSEDIREIVHKAVEKTKNNTGLILYFALNYGGRTEILSAVKKILKDNPKEEDVTEEYFNKYLQTYPMPDPDIIIRTSGEMRLSGFLPWQGVYSELFFTKTLWPDFSKDEFLSILDEYNERERRMGK